MTEIVKLEEQFTILREGELWKTPCVLKQGDSFAVFDPRGDIVPAPASEHGLYHAGTRFLSGFELLLGRRQPLLSSAVSNDNAVFTADLTNPDVVKDGRVMLTRGTLHFFRSRLLANGSWIECLRISNHGLHPIEATLAFRFDADFADVSKCAGHAVRRAAGAYPTSPGPIWCSAIAAWTVSSVERASDAREPPTASKKRRCFLIALEPHAWTQIEIDITCELGHETPPSPVRRCGGGASATGGAGRRARVRDTELEPGVQPMDSTLRSGPAG